MASPLKLRQISFAGKKYQSIQYLDFCELVDVTCRVKFYAYSRYIKRTTGSRNYERTFFSVKKLC